VTPGRAVLPGGTYICSVGKQTAFKPGSRSSGPRTTIIYFLKFQEGLVGLQSFLLHGGTRPRNRPETSGGGQYTVKMSTMLLQSRAHSYGGVRRRAACAPRVG